LKITDIVWKERIVDKLAEKHGISVAEVEDALLSRPVIRKMAKGRVRGEDLYAALAPIENGRYLVVFFIYKKRGIALPISARDMKHWERRYYDKHK